MRKIISIVGARPNFIKLAALATPLASRFNHVIIHTGQHYDYKLSKQLFNSLNIPSPKYNLNVRSGTQAIQTAKIIIGCEKILIAEKPNLVVVYGDTNSTMGGALAAAKLKIPIAHVEAGDRCGNREMPEEINRIITDHLSTLLFASSKNSLKNLKKENLENAYFSGDLMLDALKSVRIENEAVLRSLNLESGGYIYATIHRSENTQNGKTITSILNSFDSLNTRVIMPMHPRTRELLVRNKIQKSLYKNINFISPVSYSYSLALIKNAMLVLTDSGGVQKECLWLKTLCIVLRSEIEERMLVKSGWIKLLNPKKDLKYLKSVVDDMKKPKLQPSIFGTGKAAGFIYRKIAQYLKNEN